jgi:hypothetical protein
MTYEELLEDIDEARKSYGLKWDNGSPYLDAIRAVVELHKPIETYNMNNVYKSWLTCNHCNDEIYPCPTIQAIEKEL